MKKINKVKKLLTFVLICALLLPSLTVLAGTDGRTDAALDFDTHMDTYGCVYSDGSMTGFDQKKPAAYFEDANNSYYYPGFVFFLPSIDPGSVDSDTTITDGSITILPFPKNTQSFAISTVSIDSPVDESSMDTPVADEPFADDTPVADEPSMDTPAADEPSMDTPAADEPSADDTPAADEPSADDTPVADEPSADDTSVADEPSADDTPAADEPAADTPAADEPSMDTPSADDTPAADEPSMDTPSADDTPVADEPSADDSSSAPDNDVSDGESSSDKETVIPEPVIVQSDDVKTYGNRVRAVSVARSTTAYPEYTQNEIDLDIRQYPDVLQLSYKEFMWYLGHYADNYYYSSYAVYATYLLIQSFAAQFNLSALESACEDMLNQLVTDPGNAEFTLDNDQLKTELSFYNEHVMNPIEAQKAGYSLSSFRALYSDINIEWGENQESYSVNLSYNNWDGNFNIAYLPLAPVFQPVGTWYGKVSDLYVGQILTAGSLVYAETGEEEWGGEAPTLSARFFMKTSYSYVDEDSGQEKEEAAAHFIDERAFIVGDDVDYRSKDYGFDYMLTNNNSIAITRIPSQYTPVPGGPPQEVARWKVKKIIYPIITDTGVTHPFFDVDASDYSWYWHGNAYPSDDGPGGISLGCTYSSSVMVELEPCEEISVPAPKISLESISLKLEKNGKPTLSGTEISNTTEDNYYLMFTAKPLSGAGGSSDVDWDNPDIKTYSGEWNEAERLLYPGDWRIYCRAVYEKGSSQYVSDTVTQDIHITEPLLSAPATTIKNRDGSYSVTYSRPDSITLSSSSTGGTGLNNSQNSYVSYVTQQKLIRKTTENETDTPQSLSLPEGSLLDAVDFNVQDNLGENCRKIFAYTVLTLPESKIVPVPDAKDRSYYSDVVVRKIISGPTVSFDTRGGYLKPMTPDMSNGTTRLRLVVPMA